jgi:hypothetical protein
LLPAIPAGKQLHVLILFTDKSLPDYQIVFAAIGKGINHLKKALANVQPAS